MDTILDVAAYICDKYQEMYGDPIDGMKLQKLLYFTQRESLAVTGDPAFDGEFEGWKYGPVNPKVRNYFNKGALQTMHYHVSNGVRYITDNALVEYGEKKSSELSDLSHRELSWRRSRANLSPEQKGTRVLSLDDIRTDATKVRPYDHVWDMYYDEFEDADERDFIDWSDSDNADAILQSNNA